jgi:hypothetical protein
VKRLLLILLALLPLIALAGFPYQATLKEMAESADHILIGRVTGVDMIDGDGNQITNDKAGTGPGLDNKIRLRISVDEVLVSTSSSMPTVLYVPLAPHLHYRLGQIKEAHAQEPEQVLVLLRGPAYAAIKPGVFVRPLKDRDEALRLHQAAHR